MKKKIIDCALANDIISFYLQPNSMNDVCKKFNITKNRLHDLLNEYSIPQHSKEVTESLRKRKIISTNLDRYGVTNAYQIDWVAHKAKKSFKDNKEKIICKMKKTCLERYGVENYNNPDKATITRINKYGVENFFQDKSIREKAIENSKTQEAVSKKKETCLKHFGTEYPLQSELVWNKIRSTLSTKYGETIVNISQVETIKSRIKQSQYNTFMSKYGVACACLVDSCKNGNHYKDSKPNKKFEKLLLDNNLEYEREFVIERRAYDFKIGNVLIEISPSASHNSTWGLFTPEGKDSNYHKNKSLLAIKNGYQFIQVWDWINFSDIISMFKNYSHYDNLSFSVNNNVVYAHINDDVVGELEKYSQSCYIYKSYTTKQGILDSIINKFNLNNVSIYISNDMYIDYPSTYKNVSYTEPIKLIFNMKENRLNDALDNHCVEIFNSGYSVFNI